MSREIVSIAAIGKSPLRKELLAQRCRRGCCGQIKVLEHDLTAVHEAVLSPKYNFGVPALSAKHARNDGTLELVRDYGLDGRGLDLERSRKVPHYLQRMWRRPVQLTTTNQAGLALELTAP